MTMTSPSCPACVAFGGEHLIRPIIATFRHRGTRIEADPAGFSSRLRLRATSSSNQGAGARTLGMNESHPASEGQVDVAGHETRGYSFPSPVSIHYNDSFMPLFRIHRMKENPRQQFRWAPHVSGTATARPKDYEPSGEVEAENEYAAWAVLRGSETPLLVGDLLELPSGALRICKYVGFDEACWLGPVLIPAMDPAAEIMPAIPETVFHSAPA